MANRMADYVDEDVIGAEMLALAQAGKLDQLPLFDYPDEDDIAKIAWDAYQKGGVPAVKPMLDYISEDDIEKIAMDAAKRHGIPAITPLLDYLDEDFLKETIRKAYNL